MQGLSGMQGRWSLWGQMQQPRPRRCARRCASRACLWSSGSFLPAQKQTPRQGLYLDIVLVTAAEQENRAFETVT